MARNAERDPCYTQAEVNVSAQELLTFIIAIGGFLGTIALLILNLRVGAAMSEMKSAVSADMGRLELQMAHMRTEAAEDRSKLYEKIMETMAKTFVNRDASDAMHRENTNRMDHLKEQLAVLSQRVSDIG